MTDFTPIHCLTTDANISTWGKCITDTIFWGQPLLFGLTVFVFLALLAWKTRLPNTVSLMFAVIASYSLYLMQPETTYFIMFLVSVLAILAWTGYAITQRLQVR